MDIRRTVGRITCFAASLFLLLVLGALLVACGGGDSDGQKADSTTAPPTTAATAKTPAAAATSPSQASTKSVDACTLVTKADVEAAAGVTVSEPKAGALANLSTCSFEDPAPPNLSIVDVSVLTGIRDGDAREIFDMAKKNGNDPQTVAGLGEDASWDDVLHTLNVVKDNYMVGIDVGSIEGADRLTVAKAVAANVLARLP